MVGRSEYENSRKADCMSRNKDYNLRMWFEIDDSLPRHLRSKAILLVILCGCLLLGLAVELNCWLNRYIQR